jgi:hypothetical protein
MYSWEPWFFVELVNNDYGKQPHEVVVLPAHKYIQLDNAIEHNDELDVIEEPSNR